MDNNEVTVTLTRVEVGVLRALVSGVISNLNTADRVQCEVGREPLYADRIAQRTALLQKLKQAMEVRTT